MRARNGRGLAALGVAAGGVFVGHWLAYLTVRPGTHARASLLAATGHAYLPTAADVVLLVGVAAAAWTFLDRLGGRRRTDLPFRSLFPRVAAFQTAAFLALEVGERIGTAGFDGFLPILIVGMAAQLAVAAVVAWGLGALLRAADNAAALFGRAPAPSLRARLIVAWPFSSRGHDGEVRLASIRGPPLRRWR